MSSLLLFSGGLDSFAYWRLLGRPRVLYFALGHRYQARELVTLQRLREEMARRGEPIRMEIDDRLTMGDLEQEDAYIPFRNPLFFMLAAAQYPDVDTIYLGALRGESSRDKSRRFFRAMSRQLSFLAAHPLTVCAPSYRWTKTRLVREFLRRWPEDADLLKMTSSCYNAAPDALPCGQCTACFRRWVAMSQNGVEEWYEHPPQVWGKAQVQARRRDWMGRLLRAAPSEWWAIADNNLEAWRALRRSP